MRNGAVSRVQQNLSLVAEWLRHCALPSFAGGSANTSQPPPPTDGAEAGTVVEIPKGELTVGRAPSCNVVIASGLISKVHARLQRTANQVVLQDLQSINGTFVNGARVESVVVLKNG